MSNIELFRTTVATVLAGLTPVSDGTALAYRLVDTFVEEKGDGRHREMYWPIARRAGLVSGHQEQNEWLLGLELCLYRTPPGQADRTFDVFRRAVEEEATDIELAFSRIGEAQFNATTLAPELEGFEIRLFDATGKEVSKAPAVFDAVLAWVTFNFKVLVQENG